jgi:hypothetical protein
MARRCALCPTMTIIKDSISIEYRDTTVYVTQKGDTIVMESPCADLCDALGNIKTFSKTKRNNGVVTTLRTENSKLIVECNVDSLKVVIDSLEHVNTFHSEIKVLPGEIIYKETKYNGFTHWWFIFSLVALIGGVIAKRFKLF